MKRIVIILIGLISVAYGQSSPTSAKTRFVNGLYLGTKLDSYFNAADSNAIYWRADSVVMAKYKGAARALAFSGDLAPYKLIADTFFTGGYTTRARLKQYGDSLGAAKANTSLNNVNGVLSSTYGGAGSVSGLLKANGLGVVSAAVNNSDYTLLNGTGFVRMSGTTPSYLTGTSSQFVKADGSLDGTSYATAASLSGYLPLSGGTLTGALNGTSLSMSGAGSFGATLGVGGTPNFGKLEVIGGTTDKRLYVGTNAAATNSIDVIGITSAGATIPLGLAGDRISMFYGNGITEGARLATDGTFLINTTTTDGINKLIVNGGVKVDGASGNFAARINGNSTTGSSYGLGVYAGTNASDDAMRVHSYAGTEYFKIRGDGAITASSSVTANSFVKSGGTSTQALIADGSVTTLTSATYTPTLTGTTNISSVTLEKASYIRVGNLVTVTVYGTVQTTASGASDFTISLPFTAGGTAPVSGSGTVANLGIDSRAMFGRNSGTTAIKYYWDSPNTTLKPFSVTFQFGL